MSATNPTTSQSADKEFVSNTSSSSATTTPFDSSMTLTILILLTALFFVGFFSIYIRRSASAAAENYRSSSPRRPPPSKAGVGLDPSAVNSLPVVAYGRAAKHPIIIDDCTICLSEFCEGESVKVIPNCGHVFHPKCVDTWLSSHVTCPLCRSAELFGRGEEVCLDVGRCRSDMCATRAGDGSTSDQRVGGPRA